MAWVIARLRRGADRSMAGAIDESRVCQHIRSQDRRGYYRARRRRQDSRLLDEKLESTFGISFLVADRVHSRSRHRLFIGLLSNICAEDGQRAEIFVAISKSSKHTLEHRFRIGAAGHVDD